MLDQSVQLLRRWRDDDVNIVRDPRHTVNCAYEQASNHVGNPGKFQRVAHLAEQILNDHRVPA